MGISEVRIIGSCDGTSWLGLTTTIGGAGEGEKLAGAAPALPGRLSGVIGPFAGGAEEGDPLPLLGAALLCKDEVEEDAAGFAPPMLDRLVIAGVAVAVVLTAAGGRGFAALGGGGGGVLSLSFAGPFVLDEDPLRES